MFFLRPEAPTTLQWSYPAGAHQSDSPVRRTWACEAAKPWELVGFTGLVRFEVDLVWF